MTNEAIPDLISKSSTLSIEIDHSTIQWKTFMRQVRRQNLMKNKNDDLTLNRNDVLYSLKPNPSQGAVFDYYYSRDSFHGAIGPMLILGQIFGQMPIHGALGKDASDVKFQLFSWRVVITMIVFLGGMIMTLFNVAKLIVHDVNIPTVKQLIFFSSPILITYLFFRLSWRWPDLCRTIELEESRNVPPSNDKRRMSLKRKFIVVTFAIMTPALVEHILSFVSGFATLYGCDKDSLLLTEYYTSTYPQVFTFTEYAHWKAFFVQLYDFLATFCWSFMDLFIILFSIYLASKFDNLNQLVLTSEGQNLPEHFWKVVRNEYANLSNLVSQIDQNINEMVLLSFASNLFIICMQLFFGFETRDGHTGGIPCWRKLYNGIFTTLYFVVSFTFLLFRFLTVAMTASSIYINSQVPVNMLFSVASETYCVEVQRLLHHMSTNIISLTGMNFFRVTRGLILTIAGTVVTYELVLVQFNQPPPSVSANITLKNHCGEVDSINTFG